MDRKIFADGNTKISGKSHFEKINFVILFAHPFLILKLMILFNVFV